ncbi:MarR family winged helix-turn-helix transcriptional regulator [Streptomyces mangrovisoli]|uniref:MarR family transcriptional regulator n=1 Tax=Streptomyces mangrovisoli TaxID=1428628 RepID=A0A1J4NRJ5_9ACTN|nr:MarR family winged helix-turn-helix transcriptional regulator [Streptomyces mangrovisoli]OIJ64939.1 MarR family transcriptional regulator [Streptomyces mangrovisoli]
MNQHTANLPQLFSEGRRWFEEALFASMEAAGEQAVTTAQAQVFAMLDPEGTTVAELARRMGVARQSAHQAVHSLIGMGLLRQTPAPGSARDILIRTTQEGQRVHERAQATIKVIEDVLASRIGVGELEPLRKLLAADWGEPPCVTAP